MNTLQASPLPLALVVEDEPLILMETADMLADNGFRPIEANHAAQALEKLAEHPGVVLMVTDVQMPGPMKGFALAREAHRLYPALSIIVCSGQMKPIDGEMPALALFIDKPMSAGALARGLRGFKLAV